jgi:copper(I)-binding protein
MKLKSLALIAAVACSTTYAQNVEVKDAWIRTSVQGQKATGAFMKITAKDSAKLVGVSSPAAGVAQVHEMKMEGNIMKMQAVPGGLDIPGRQDGGAQTRWLPRHADGP